MIKNSNEILFFLSSMYIFIMCEVKTSSESGTVIAFKLVKRRAQVQFLTRDWWKFSLFLRGSEVM